jgi:preprotein translocase subunit SecD
MAVSVRRVVFSGLSVWFLVTAIGLYFLVHLHKYINFGIDLVGGTYITLDIDSRKALHNELGDTMQALVARLKKDRRPLPLAQRLDDESAVMSFSKSSEASEVEQYFYNNAPRVRIERKDSDIILSLPREAQRAVIADAVQSIIGVLRTRLDKFGVGEISIAAQGDTSIIVELPNVHNPQQAKAMIGRTALLEIKLVEDVAVSEEELLKKNNGQLPLGMIVVPGKERFGKTVYLVPNYTDLTGRLLKDARMDFGGRIGTEPVVAFTFKDEGADKFYELTSNNIGRRVAIIIDNEVITAPTVQSAIGESGVITGDFTPQEAQDMAALLKSGAFVAPVTFEEERHIGPSLGQESIHKGLVACAVGLGLLLVFSLLFYKVAGLFAFIVLLYNLLLTLFMLAWLGATLTLPGIAGMILTVGMAIDASILIYERIKEELAIGAPLKRAIDAGFSGAMTVILDANVTHFIVAVVLYRLGAGPVQGFAVTMIVGIIATLLTGLLLLRSIFSFVTDVLEVKRISI